MEHERVPVRIGKDRHVTDAAVDRLAEEGHALGLERGARGCDVIDVQCDRMRAGLELAADRRGVQELEREVPGLELRAGDAVVADGALQSERRLVEGTRRGEIGDEDGHEVNAADVRV